MEFESPFDNEEYYYDAYGDANELEQKVGQPLTIEELRAFMNARMHVTYGPEDTALFLDEKSGLYYTDALYCASGELLIRHILVELCMEKRDQVDWQRVTGNYDYRLIDDIRTWYNAPLTWVYPAETIGMENLIWGLVATPHSYAQRWSRVDILEFWEELKVKALLWFADNLPTNSEANGSFLANYHGLPPDMPLWDRLCAAKRTSDRNVYIFAPDTFKTNIELIAQKRGTAKAAELVRALRADWQDIVVHQCFRLDQMTEEETDQFEVLLFAGMDRYMRIWESQATQRPAASIAAFTLLTDQCRKEGKAEAIQSELRAACQYSATALWKTIHINEALGYLATRDMSASKIFRAFSDYFGELPYNERNFRDARHKK